MDFEPYRGASYRILNKRDPYFTDPELSYPIFSQKPPSEKAGTDGTGGSSGDGTQQDIFTITEAEIFKRFG